MPDARDRGVSEVVGFTLAAAMIVSIVGLAFVAGLGGLEGARDAERVQNAERAFGVLADNINDVHRQGVPHRATEIKLADATLGFGNTTNTTVHVHNDGLSDSTYVLEYDPIVYRTGRGSAVVYDSGAVIREDENGGAVLKRGPSMTFRDGAFTMATASTVQTRATGSESVGSGGSTTVLVRTDLAKRELLGSHNDPGTVSAADPDGDGTDELTGEYWATLTVNTTETRAPVWNRSLNDRVPAALDANDVDGDGSFGDDPACALSGDTVTCELRLERLYVSATRVDIAFES